MIPIKENQDGAISEPQWERILEGRKVRLLANAEQLRWAGAKAVRCIGCANAGDVGGDPWRAWCLVHRQMVSNTFAVLCREYRARFT